METRPHIPRTLIFEDFLFRPLIQLLRPADVLKHRLQISGSNIPGPSVGESLGVPVEEFRLFQDLLWEGL